MRNSSSKEFFIFRIVCRASDVAPGGAARLLLSVYRSFAAPRVVYQKPAPWFVRLFADQWQRLPAASARAAAALLGFVAAAARWLHGGAVFWSFVPQ